MFALIALMVVFASAAQVAWAGDTFSSHTKDTGDHYGMVALPSAAQVASVSDTCSTYAKGTGDDYDTDCTYGGVLSLTVDVTGPAPVFDAAMTVYGWDVDVAEGEVDHVYINGQFAGTMTGSNETWHPTTFVLDPSWVVSGTNQIEYLIDVENGGWCSAVDWVTIVVDGGGWCPEADYREEEIDPELDADYCETHIGSSSIDVATGEVTYGSSWPDAEVQAGGQAFSLRRKYSTAKAFADAGREAGTSSPPFFRAFAGGWYHELEHALVDEGDGYTHHRPSGHLESFAGPGSARAHPAIQLALVVGGAEVQMHDGQSLEFAWTATDPSVARLERLVDAHGNTTSLTYWTAGGTSPCDASTQSRPEDYEGQLCLAEYRDSSGLILGGVLFSDYGRTQCLVDLECTGCVDPDCDMGTPVLQAMQYGAGDDPSLHRFQTTYTHVAIPVALEDNGSTTTYLTSYLTEVARVSLDTGEINRESYTYTQDSYYRPDLGTDPFLNPYQNSSPILVGFAADISALGVPLLRQIRDRGGELVEGYEYTQWGQGAATYGSGKLLRFLYTDPGLGRTVVYNESEGTLVEYTLAGGRVADISDTCGCSGATGGFERDATTNQVIAKSDLGGTRTRYFLDAAARTTLALVNWDDQATDPPPDTVALKDDPSDLLNGPTRVMRYAYDAAVTTTPTVESRVASAVCPLPAGTTWPLTCPSAWDEPTLTRDFDPEGDPEPPNSNPGGTVVTRELRAGLTLESVESTPQVVSRTLVTSYSRDSANRVLSTLDTLGNGISYVYYPDTDPNEHNRGQVRKRMWGATLLEERGDYNAQGLPTWVERLGGPLETLVYDARGRLLEQESTAGSETRVVKYTYNASGQLESVSRGPSAGFDTLSVTRALDYTPPAGVTPGTDLSLCDTQTDLQADATVIAALQAQCLTDLGYLGRSTGEQLGMGAEASFVDLESTAYTYGSTGQPTLTDLLVDGVLQRRGQVVYDEAGRPIRRVRYTSSSSEPTAVIDTYYDVLGRPVLVTDARFGGEVTGGVLPSYYDNVALANRETVYDALGRVSAVVTGKGTDAEAVTWYYYDVHDNLMRVVDADGRTTRYLYDDFGQLVLVDSPDTGVTLHEYDAAGNLVWKQNGEDQITRYDYDSRYRLQTETFAYGTAEETTRQYLYDSPGLAPGSADCDGRLVELEQVHVEGRLSWVRGPAGRTYFSYNGFGELSAVVEQDDDVDDPFICSLRVTRHAYDGAGRLVRMVYPSGREVTYVYDAGSLYPSRVQVNEPGGSATDVLTNLAYDAGGVLQSYIAGAVSLAVSRDLSGQTEQRLYTAGGEALLDWSVSDRDASGNIERVGDATGTNEVWPRELVLTYDGQDRLASAQGRMLRGYQECIYEYDDSGNRLWDECYDKRIEFGYTTDTSQHTSLAWVPAAVCSPDPADRVSRPISRDGIGRATSGYTRRFPLPDDSYTLAYGPDGRLASATIGADTWEYVYDHHSLRRRKQGPDGTTVYVYDTSGRLVYEQGPGDGIQELVYLQGEPVAMIVDADGVGSGTGDVYILGVDHLATPQRAMAPSTGEEVWAADYEAFGRAWEYVPGSASSPTVEVNLRFPGQYFDRETGLHYNWNRFYDPDTGRYLTPDPLVAEAPGSRQPVFSYALNNPISHIDRDGRVVQILVADALIAGGIAAGGAFLICRAAGGCLFPWEVPPSRPRDVCEPTEQSRAEPITMAPDLDTEDDPCVQQYEDDYDTCKSLMTKTARSRCYVTAGDRLSYCNRTGILGFPPLITHL